MKKSENIDKISSIYRPGTEISVNFSALRHTRVWGHFFFPNSRRYIDDISTATCVANIDPAEDLTVQICPLFSTTSLTNLMARFESALIQWPRFHPNLKCHPTVIFLIQRPEFKS